MPRLPPSLKWLIDKRARVTGEINKIERLLDRCRQFTDELNQLKELLASLDATLGLHDIKIDPNNIKPIRSHEVRINLPHGELLRSVLTCLRLNAGTQVSTDDITAFVAARYADLNAEPTNFIKLRISVRYCLKTQCTTGLVRRHHQGHTFQKGWWSISAED
jgi:hypothetical protein